MKSSELDLPRLTRAIGDAISAVPVAACQHHEGEVRRACQEMSLYLYHLKELADRLQRLLDQQRDRA